MLSNIVKKFGLASLVIFAIVFMGFIFGPAEIFFGNHKELGFIYQEFGWKFCVAGVIITIATAGIVSFLPEKIYKGILALTSGVTVAAYAQSMFFNKGLDQIGVTAEGYIPELANIVKNTLLWCVMIVAVFVLIYLYKERWRKAVALLSGILMGVQLVAFATLFATADKEAFEYTVGETCLDMSGQYTVSSNENILVIVLDNVANEWMYSAEEEYPDIYDGMKDFTYYRNADCNYYGTFPSVVHFLTGYPLDMSVSTNEYMVKCWTNKQTEDYFSILEEHNYIMNVYTHLHEVLTAGNPLELVEGKVNNLMQKGEDIEIDYPKLYKTMIQMSLYRYLPEYFKPQFDVKNEQYASIVSYPDNEMKYSNPNFYNALVQNGLTLDEDFNYFVINHLNGGHEFINDEYCQYSNDISRSGAIKGMFVLVEEYLEQLREAGIYDSSTVIVMSDHGTGENAQPIFFFKGKNERHDVMQRSDAPITYDEFVPTVLEMVGVDYTAFGRSIHDVGEDEVRERLFIDRAWDSNYPSVKRYDGMNAGANIWQVYRYAGDLSDIQSIYIQEQYDVIPMIDSYY